MYILNKNIKKKSFLITISVPLNSIEIYSNGKIVKELDIFVDDAFKYYLNGENILFEKMGNMFINKQFDTMKIEEMERKIAECMIDLLNKNK